MRSLRSVQLLLAMLASSIFISACGGGGSSPETAPSTFRATLPILSIDEEPTGPLQRLDPAYFATQIGDTYEFITTDEQGTQSNAVARVVTTHPTTGNGFVLEDTQGPEQWSTVYLRGANGWTQDLRFSSDLPIRARELIGTILEFPAAVADSSQSRRSVRQGPWGADLDGDQVSESFRFEFSQRFVGIEPEVYFGKTITVAHFQTTTTFSIVYSRPDEATRTYVTTEDTYFAQGFGQVRILSTERELNAKSGASSWRAELKEATSGGKSWSDYIRTNGTKIPVDLTFREMVYDKHRNVYYASVPASDIVNITQPAHIPPGANSIATIDAATGRVTYSAVVGSSPGPLALASDGSVLWVGVDDTFEVVQLSLPDMTVTARSSVSAYLELYASPVPASQLQPSPTDPTVFAAVLARSPFSRSVATILVKNMVILPDVLTSTPDHIPSYSPHINLLAFDETGTTLFGIDSYDAALLSRIQVSAAGLTRVGLVPYNTTDFGGAGGPYMDFVGNTLVAGNKLISVVTSSMSNVVGGQCRKLNTEKIICMRSQVDRASFITGTELVPITLTSRIEDSPISIGKFTGADLTSMVVGGPGQVAIGTRIGSSTTGSPSNGLFLFQNPNLR